MHSVSRITHVCESLLRLKTMPSQEEAERSLMVVTHEGPCGVCSSFQDLTVYMKIPDLASVGI